MQHKRKHFEIVYYTDCIDAVYNSLWLGTKCHLKINHTYGINHITRIFATVNLHSSKYTTYLFKHRNETNIGVNKSVGVYKRELQHPASVGYILPEADGAVTDLPMYYRSLSRNFHSV